MPNNGNTRGGGMGRRGRNGGGWRRNSVSQLPPRKMSLPHSMASFIGNTFVLITKSLTINSKMKKTKNLYWIFTSLFAFMMLGSAIPDILSMSDAVKGMHDALGYPRYFIPFIGTASSWVSSRSSSLATQGSRNGLCRTGIRPGGRHFFHHRSRSGPRAGVS